MVLLSRGSIYQLLLFGILLGACIALSIVESVFGVPDLEYAWPISFVALALLNWAFFRHRERRLLAELAVRQAGSPQGLLVADESSSGGTTA